MGSRMATLKDVAAAAGVSRTTASNAYNRPGRLSAAVQARILAAARELGYPGPDPVARSLRTGRVGTVGVLLAEALTFAFDDPAAVLLLREIAEASQLADIGLSLLPAPPERPTGTAALTHAVARAVVDGFLVYQLPDGHPSIPARLGPPPHRCAGRPDRRGRLPRPSRRSAARGIGLSCRPPQAGRLRRRGAGRRPGLGGGTHPGVRRAQPRQRLHRRHCPD